MNDIIDNVPPHSLDAERCLLGCLMLFPQDRPRTAEALQPSDFYWESHQTIFARLVAFIDAGQPFDLDVLIDTFRCHAELDSIGGEEALRSLAEWAISPATMEYHARRVLLHSQLRQINSAAIEMQRQIHVLAANPQEILDRIEQEVFAIAERGQSGEAVHIGTVLRQLAADLRAGKGLDRGLETGFIDLDDALRGLHPSQLIILAARPSIGKTSMALTIALHIAKTVPVLLFSLEMVASELAFRTIAEQSQVSAWCLRGHDLGAEKMQTAARAADETADTALWIDATSALHLSEIRGRTRRMVARKGVGLVVVDYLQLVHGNRQPGDSREQEVASISRGLKRLAGECNVPVLALAQLRRRPPGVKAAPRLDELRESGSLEQDADVVLLLHREDIYTSVEATLHIAKQRHGPTKRVELTWSRDRVRFLNKTAPFLSGVAPKEAEDAGDGEPY